MAHSKAANRYSMSLSLKNKNTSRLYEDKTTTFTRPRSAISERIHPSGGAGVHGSRRVQSASVHRTKYRQHSSCHEPEARIAENGTSFQVASYKSKNNASRVCSNNDFSGGLLSQDTSRKLPSSLGPLAELAHIDLDGAMLGHTTLGGSVAILPCLQMEESSRLAELPASPLSNDEPYPYTHILPTEHIHKPKKYSHPYYDRIKSIKGWVCNHTSREIRLESTTGETIHRFKVNAQRSKAEVRREIEELERLMKGLSTDWGTASVVLYQNEINSLQQMVKDTLALTQCPDTPPATPDPTGLRSFCKEYDTALQALRHRHEQCMLELNRLEEYEYFLYQCNELLKVTTE